MNAATLTVDAARVSPSRALARLARAAAYSGGPLVVVTGRAYGELIAELGGDDAAVQYLARVVTGTSRPIAVNLPTGPDTSTTLFVSPKGWSQERLAGWAAGRHQELEAAFGPATVLQEHDL